MWSELSVANSGGAKVLEGLGTGSWMLGGEVEAERGGAECYTQQMEAGGTRHAPPG